MSTTAATPSVIGLHRKPGFLQGIMLLLPITMNVMGITVLTPVVHLLLEEFKAVPYHDYMVIGGVVTMPSIWVLLFSPVAGWLADRFGRRNLLLASMVVYALVGIAPAFLKDLYAIIASRIGGRHLRIHRHHRLHHHDRRLFQGPHPRTLDGESNRRGLALGARHHLSRR